MISTKIIATIGPASDSEKIISNMYNAGMRVARLNFSHGDYAYFSKLVRTIRNVSEEIAILLDTKGPEIRSGEVENGSIELSDEDKLILTTKKVVGNNKILTVNYKYLNKLKKGDLVLIDDGLIEFQVLSVGNVGVKVKVLNGGKLGSRKTVSLKGHSVKIPFLSKKDKDDINFAIENNFDFVAASFVRTVSDVMAIRKIINNSGSKIRVISKIEHWEALENLEGIIENSQGIMVARGDLGVEIPMEEVPRAQKDMVKRCNELGKPVIVATQMLESMQNNPRPTRAEISDVANAILEGADAVMLSGETAGGKYPVHAVKTMARIAKEYEKDVNVEISDTLHTTKELEANAISLFVTKAAANAAKTIPSSVIMTPTESGYTARKVSRFKPKVPIYAITRDKTIFRQLQLSWGVFPVIMSKVYKSNDEMVFGLFDLAKNKGLLDGIRNVVITSGHTMAKAGQTNSMEVFNVRRVMDGRKSASKKSSVKKKNK